MWRPSNWSLGYTADETERTIAGDGEVIEAVRLLVRREDWQATQRRDITLTGMPGCADLFGL